VSEPDRILSVVLPTLGVRARLERSLPALCDAMGALEAQLGAPRSTEIVVVDDSGEGLAAAALPEVLAGLGEAGRSVPIRTVATERNLGFGPAVMRGGREAEGEHLLVLHDDVLIGAGAVAALLQVLAAAPEVFATAPALSRAAAGGAVPVPPQVVRLEDDWIQVRPAPEQGAPGAAPQAGALAPQAGILTPPAETLGGHGVVDLEVIPSAAMLVRRGEFLDLGGFDRLFGPAALEDVDLSLCARRRGRRLVAVPRAEAVHLDLGDGLGDLLPAPVERAVTARNRLLLRWKHLATRADAADHLVALWRATLEAGMTGDRETLEGIALAIDRLGEMAESRATLSGAAPLEL